MCAPAALSINPARGVGVGACAAVVEIHLAVLIVGLAGVADPIAKLHGVLFARLLCHGSFHPCGGWRNSHGARACGSAHKPALAETVRVLTERSIRIQAIEHRIESGRTPPPEGG